MVVTTNYAVKFNDQLLGIQPSRVNPIPPKAHRHQGLDGGFISFTRDKGWEFEVEFTNIEIVDDAPLVELQTIQAAMTGPTIKFSFTWYDGQEYDFYVLWDEFVAAAFRWGSLAERFTIHLYQATEEVVGS